MQQSIARIHRGLAMVILGGLVLQFYLAGFGLFGAGSMNPHRILGYVLGLAILLLPIIALAGRLGRRTIGMSALVGVLGIVQAMLPSLRSSVPLVAALHPLTALALMGVTAAIGRGAQATVAEREHLAAEPARGRQPSP